MTADFGCRYDQRRQFGGTAPFPLIRYCWRGKPTLWVTIEFGRLGDLIGSGFKDSVRTSM